MGDKKKLLIGLIFIIFAFLGVVTIFYFLLNAQSRQMQEIESLTEQMKVIDTQRDAALEKVEQLEQEVGTSLFLEKIISAAKEVYGPEEQKRNEGYLWIDRKGGTIIATLGALNGVVPGSRLTVYEGDKRIGFVTVKTPIDVISYIVPDRRLLEQFETDYYRVVLEK